MTSATRRDPPSLGNPRLFFAMGGRMTSREPQREFALVDEVTTIGSASDADLQLVGLEACHAEIRLGEDDNYTYVPLCPPSGGTVHGRSDVEAILRTGTLIGLGLYRVSFYREEFADSCAPARSKPGGRFAQMRAEAQQAGVRID